MRALDKKSRIRALFEYFRAPDKVIPF